MSRQGDSFHYALKSNASWANYKQHSSPQYFERFAAGQSPSILWLGCSDSRCPETTLLGLQPGEVFVHRNIANIITPSDLSALSVIEYAVAHLKVSHIVLCGHTFCGGAAAALGDGLVGGVLDAWLAPLKIVRAANAAVLESIRDDKERAVKLAELNVENGVRNLMSNHVVVEHIKSRGLQVHGSIYDVACGLVRDLGVGTDGSSSGRRAGAAAGAAGGKLETNAKKVVAGNHGTMVFGNSGASLAIR